MPSVSAIILARDSERTISRCIESLKGAVDQIVVVDTGSTDDTVNIAKSLGARVYHFEWIDNFAAARNFGDSLATTEWVIHVDSDEVLHSEDKAKIRKFCSMHQKSDMPMAVPIHIMNTYDDHAEVVQVMRMYKRGAIKWHGIIHEQMYSVKAPTFYHVQSDIRFFHDGYNPSVVDRAEKMRRNILLLEKGLEQEPSNPFYHFFLGREYSISGNHRLAIPALRHSVDLMQKQNLPQLIPHAYQLIIASLESLGDHEAAASLKNSIQENLNR